MGSIFSSLKGPLTKTGVTTPGGGTDFYSNPAQATQALAAASDRTAAPVDSTVDGTIGPATISPVPMANAGDVVPGQENLTFGTSAPPVAPQPTLVKPSFASAQDDPRLLTTKGTILSLILNSMAGAANGWAAVSNGSPRTGYPGPGVAAGVGFSTPFELARQRQALTAAALENQARQAQVNAAPAAAAAENAVRQSEVNRNNAIADRKDNYLIPGVGLVNSDGNVIAAEPAKDSSMSTPAGRKVFLDQADPDSHVLSGRDRLQFLATGSWPKTVEPGKPIYVPRVGIVAPDGVTVLTPQPGVQPRATKPADASGLTASQARLLKSDPELSTLTQALRNAESEREKAAGGLSLTYDAPEQVQPIIDDLQTRIAARQAVLMKAGSGSLSLRGKASPANAAANPLVGQIKVFNGRRVRVTGVDSNGNAQVVPVQ